MFNDPMKAAGLLSNLDEPKFSDIIEAIRTFARLHELSHHTDRFPDGSGREPYLTAVRSLVGGDFDAALRQFVDIIRLDRYYDDDGSRKACISLFKLLGDEHQLTLKYRREFSSALY